MSNPVFAQFKRRAELLRLLAHWTVEIERLRKTGPNSEEYHRALTGLNATEKLLNENVRGRSDG